MAGTIYSGTYVSGIVLNNPTTQLPATIAASGYVTNMGTLHNGDAVYGTLGTAWTLANLGTIRGGAIGSAVQLESGGYVANAGSINSSAGGIEIDTAAGTVVNSGAISGATGVSLQTSGTITNTGAISGALGIEAGVGPATIINQATGTIAGTSTAAVFDPNGGPVTVVNSGAIANTGTNGEGIRLEGGGSVANTGSITASSAGVDFEGAVGTVVNSGVIAGGAGIYLAVGGTITNTGTITATLPGAAAITAGRVTASPAAITNLGTISTSTGTGISLGPGTVVNGSAAATAARITGYNGVSVYYGAGTVTNFGTILAYGGAGGAVNLFAGGSITNQSGALLQGGGVAVYVSGGTGTVANIGTINGTSSYGIVGTGVSFGTLTGGSTLINAGTIIGQSGSVYVYGTGFVTQPGTAVAFYGGNNRLIIDPGASFTGIVNGGTANDTLELAAGTGIGTLSGFGTSFIGFETLAVDAAASWQLAAGNTIASGIVLTDSGTLANAGLIASTVTLTAGGILDNRTGSVISNAVAYAVLGTGGPGTVFNVGTISSTGVSSSGIDLTAGGTISNSGSISSSGPGITLAAGGTVSNSGSISSSGPGITLAAGGTVSNSGSIAGGFAGIAVQGASGTISNSGSINGGYAGVYLASGGTINNATGGTVTGYFGGISIKSIKGAPGTVTNSGVIADTGTNGSGVKLAASSGTLTNAGTISGASGTAVSFYGSGNRLILDPGNVLDGTSTVTGTGAVNNTLELAAGAVPGAINSAFYGFDTLQVDASASWSVSGPFTFANGTIAVGASLSETGPLTITSSLINSGSIAAAVTLTAGASLTNQASGTISDSGDAVTGSGGSATLTNAGTIGGAGGTAVSFAGNGNRLVVDPGAVFSGIVNGGAGSDTLELAAGANTGTLSGLGTGFTGFTTVAVDPAAVWQVSDAPAAPAFTNDGTIIVGSGGLVFGAVSEDSGRSGVIELSGSSTAEFTGTVASGQTVLFTGASGGEAKLDAPGGFAGAVAGFQPGDTIDLAGLVANGASYAGGILTLTESGTQIARLDLTTPLGAHASFRLYPDGAGGTNLTVAARPGNIFPGFYPNGIVLNNPAIESPPTITSTAYVTNAPGHNSVYAAAGFAWTLATYGRIAGPGDGVAFAAPGVVDNGGTITGTNGIDLTAGGTIANSGTATGSAGAGGYLGNGGYLLNGAGGASGALLTGRYGVEISGGAGSGVIAVNQATIYGTAIGFAAGDSVGDTLVNAGTIGGGSGVAIQFGDGSNLLVADPGAVFHGRVNGGAGYNAIELAAGSKAGALLGLGTKFDNFAAVAVDPGAIWHLAGAPTAPPAVANDGRIIVGGGHRLTLGAVGADPGMSGVIAVRTSGTLAFAGGVDPTQTVRFADKTGTLVLDDPQEFGATIQGFRSGDVIDFANTPADGFTYAGGVLTLTSGGNPTASVALSGTLGASQFALAPDGKGGTDVTAAAGQLFAFTFVYADGDAYYSGTVADNGSLGYAALVNSGNPTISEPDGTYTLAGAGPATTEPSGAVTVTTYTASPPEANAAQSYVPLGTSQGQFDGHAGLGSEADSIRVNGTVFPFSPSLEFHPLLAS